MSSTPRLRRASWNSGLSLQAASHSSNSSSTMGGWMSGTWVHEVTVPWLSETTAS